MTEPERPFDIRGTMQVHPDELTEVREAAAAELERMKHGPPPLPGAELARRKRIKFAAIVFGMLSVAAVGGWLFARVVGKPDPAAAPAASAAPSAQQMTLPTVEIR